VPVHGVAINAGADLRAVRPLFERGRRVQWDDFALDATNLRTWAKQMQADVATTT
jgi:3-phenylpropionate/trans-cinnamate dioxygenase ferredoxin reductase subunit